MARIGTRSQAKCLITICTQNKVYYFRQKKNKPHVVVCKCAFVLELGMDANNYSVQNNCTPYCEIITTCSSRLLCIKSVEDLRYLFELNSILFWTWSKRLFCIYICLIPSLCFAEAGKSASKSNTYEALCNDFFQEVIRDEVTSMLFTAFKVLFLNSCWFRKSTRNIFKTDWF